MKNPARRGRPQTVDEVIRCLPQQFLENALEVDQMQRRELPIGWDRDLPVFPADPKGLADTPAANPELIIIVSGSE
jgi:hypothetical protein